MNISTLFILSWHSLLFCDHVRPTFWSRAAMLYSSWLAGSLTRAMGDALGLNGVRNPLYPSSSAGVGILVVIVCISLKTISLLTT